MCRSKLEGVTSADILQLLGDLGWRSVQFLRHALLLVRVHTVELLTQISVNHILGKTKTIMTQTKFVSNGALCSNACFVNLSDIRRNNRTNLDREVVRSEAEVVSAAEWRELGAHMHF